jgi:small subunit ribosomal protein S17
MTAEKGLYGGRKTREGTVVSDKMENTVVVAVQTSRRHPLYKKTIRRVHKFMAHDASGNTKLGDVVRIVEIAPVSRRKRWGVVEVLERAELPEVAPGSIDLEIIGEVKPEAPEEEAPVAASAAETADEAVPDAEASDEGEAMPDAETEVEAEPATEAEPVAETEVEAETEPGMETESGDDSDTPAEGATEDAEGEEEEPK